MFKTIRRFLHSFSDGLEYPDAYMIVKDEERLDNILSLSPEEARAAFFVAVESGRMRVTYAESSDKLVGDLPWSGRDMFQQVGSVLIVSTGFSVERKNVKYFATC